MANRTVKVWLEANAARYIAAMKAAGAATKDLHNEIDKTNDRTAWLAQGILAIAPAATTLGAGAVPVIAGMATQMTVAAGAAGVMALGFNGIGDALKALNDYQLDPTDEKLKKLEQTMGKVGEEGEQFVRFLDSLSPQFRELAETSREGMFPGVTAGLREVLDLLPEVDRIIAKVADGIGRLAKDAGQGLSGEGFADFFNYLENDARPILVRLGRTIGNFTEGMANMMVAFGPLSRDFSKGLLDMSRSFVEWSEGLQSSTGFNEFVDYVREAGPLALDFLGTLAMTFVEILEAAAPVGAVALPALTKMLDVIATLADTPLGPTIIAFGALTSAWGRLNAIAAITGSGVLAKATSGLRLNLATANMLKPSIGELGTAFYRMGQDVEHQSKQTRLAMTQTKAFGKAIAPVAGQAALLGLAMTGVAEKAGLTNTTTLALAGSMAGPWGAAAGAAIGLTMDLAAANDNLVASLEGTQEALDRAFNQSAGTVDIDAVAAQYRAAYDARESIRREIEAGGLAGVKARFEDWFGNGDDYYDAYAELKQHYDDLQVLREREAKASRERANDEALFLSIKAETAALEDNIDAMREKRNEALRGMNADLDYAQALLDVRAAAKENTDVLSKNGDLIGGPKMQAKGIEALRELNNLATGWNGLSDEAQNVPGAYKGAIDAFVKAAEQMGIGERQARRMAREIMNIPTKWETKIKVDADEAFKKIRALQRSIEAIDRNIVITVGAIRGDTTGVPFVSGGQAPRPTGQPAPTTPGGKVGRVASTSIPGGATERSISVGRTYPAATSSTTMTTAPEIDYDRLTSAMLLARPVHGDVHISGDPSEYRRQMQKDEQAAGLGGRPVG